MRKYKILTESPPSKIVDLVNQIQGFQTPKLAKELWDIGENILKKERLWGKFQSVMGYSCPHDMYKIEHEKINFFMDDLSFYYVNTNDRILNTVHLYRLKGPYALSDKVELSESLRNCFYGKIIGVLTTEGGEEKNLVSFLQKN